jgi:hypothetical protein
MMLVQKLLIQACERLATISHGTPLIEAAKLLRIRSRSGNGRRRDSCSPSRLRSPPCRRSPDLAENLFVLRVGRPHTDYAETVNHGIRDRGRLRRCGNRSAR